MTAYTRPGKVSSSSWVLASQMTSNDKRTTERAAHGEILTEVSEGLVKLLKEYYGKGPTQAKTYYEDDLVVCLLRGGFTAVEQTLLEGGRGAAVIDQRMAFQDVMRQRFEAVVEHATGRRVVGFMSGNQQHPDMICEVFILAPSSLFKDTEIPPKPSAT
jgi:uncharacterized protein YbcI